MTALRCGFRSLIALTYGAIVGHSTGGITALTRSYRCAVSRSTSGVQATGGIGSVRDGARWSARLREMCGRSSGPKIPAIGMARSFLGFRTRWGIENAQYEHI